MTARHSIIRKTASFLGKQMGQQASDISAQSDDGQNQSNGTSYTTQQDQGQADGTSYGDSTNSPSSERLDA